MRGNANIVIFSPEVCPGESIDPLLLSRLGLLALGRARNGAPTTVSIRDVIGELPEGHPNVILLDSEACAAVACCVDRASVNEVIDTFPELVIANLVSDLLCQNSAGLRALAEALEA